MEQLKSHIRAKIEEIELNLAILKTNITLNKSSHLVGMLRARYFRQKMDLISYKIAESSLNTILGIEPELRE